MPTDNVVQLPTLLDRLADALRNDLDRDAANRQEWIGIQERICANLAEARGQFPAHIEFGRWCENEGFGADRINHQDRAAAIKMGDDPTALHACLEATDRRSLRLIYELEFKRFTSAGKTERRKQEKLDLSNPSPEFERCKDAYDELKAAGEIPTVDKVAQRAGTSGTPARIAVAYKHGEEAPRPLLPDEMSASMAKRYEAAIRKARIEIREELRQEVYKECDVFVASIKERAERADRILAGHNGMLSRDAFRRIKACLHPDHNTFTFAAEALQTFSELEDVLVKPDPPPRDGIPPLPQTAAELMARRRR